MEGLEAANTRIAELEGQTAALAAERDAAVQLGEALRGELGPLRSQAEQVPVLAAERDATVAALADTRTAALEATRRAILAENAGSVVPELIAGDTVEALTASVEVARAAQERATEAARAVLAGQTVPAGAGSARGLSLSEGMSPLEMISAGLDGGKGGR